ncbi:unnamed protein product [Pylaiella littoralis]
MACFSHPTLPTLPLIGLLLLSRDYRRVQGFRVGCSSTITRRVRQYCLAPPSTKTKTSTLAASFNPFSGLGKSVSSMLSGATGSVPDDFDDKAPSWESLESMLDERQTPEEKGAVALRGRGYGPTSALANLRLFDAPEGTEPRVTLYRDHAAWCPYCEKVWLLLEEKRIPYRVEKVPMRCYGNKPSWFSEVSPSGAVPVANIDGRIISESNVIMQVLEATFPDKNPLLPAAGSPLAKRVDPLLRLEREIFSAWFRWLTSSGANSAAFDAAADKVDKALKDGGGPYFLGKELSYVDLMFTPFLERMSASLPYYKGLEVRRNPRWPNIDRWFDAMDTREVYRGAKSDYYTHCHDLPPQIGGCRVEAAGVPFKDEIDGKDGSWHLPLSPDGGLEPVGSAFIPEDLARRQAAAKLVGNRKAVVPFALRGVGLPGVPGAMAELADPYAKPNQNFSPPVDAALRHVVHALLEGHEAAKATGLSQNNPVEQVQLCLEYLRERVGVPRDMPFAAARQLRAHLNWYSGELLEQR